MNNLTELYLVNRILDLEDENKELKQATNNQETEVNQDIEIYDLQETIKDLKDEIKKLKDEIKEIEQDNKVSNEYIKDLENECNELEAENKKLKNYRQSKIKGIAYALASIENYQIMMQLRGNTPTLNGLKAQLIEEQKKEAKKDD